MPKHFGNYQNNNPLIISCCLCGAGTKKNQAPTVPYTPEEISDQAIAAAKAGAAVVHIHVREDKEVNGEMQIGYKSMSLEKFTQAVQLTRAKAKAENIDVVVNLTTSGGEYEDYKRLQHLGALKPEMCSFDPGTLNWSNAYIFENHPRFLNALSEEVKKYDIKPEFEVFDTGMIGSVNYYVKKHEIPGTPYYQFIMNVGGAMPGDPGSLAWLVDHLPEGALWSVSGIGHAHMAMMLTGLALGCDGLRVGLEDNIIYGKDDAGNKVIATNVQLVERAAVLAKMAGRKIATAEQARQLLGITRHCLRDEG